MGWSEVQGRGQRQSTKRGQNCRAGVRISIEQQSQNRTGQNSSLGGKREKGRFRLEVRKRKRPGQHENGDGDSDGTREEREKQDRFGGEDRAEDRGAFQRW